ncbi:hypothetical protein [Saccharothrix texasensis]|uniref:Uncharacterized protein n=1 Tax=Saccharothrix texasensis TaxID=103734 RepID=A0A3N1H138_9PSEU|nr:hypothetical protein [Saccharothrix texasensis]ROP36096.1 hypothetical protein EDD40_1358 [Saccharothrix texasensis]
MVRGDIRLGDAVRIGARTSILAFNHTVDDPDTEVFRQAFRSDAWSAGAWVDALGTALHWNRRLGAPATPGDGLRRLVNGCYRASRGTSPSSICPCRTRNASWTRSWSTSATPASSARSSRTPAPSSTSPTRSG